MLLISLQVLLNKELGFVLTYALREWKGIQIRPAAKLRVCPEHMELLEQIKISILYLLSLDMTVQNLGFCRPLLS